MDTPPPNRGTKATEGCMFDAIVEAVWARHPQTSV